MTTEPQSLSLYKPPPVHHAPRRRRGWVAGIALAGLAAVILAGAWWYWHRPANCYRRGRRALEAGDWKTVVRESRRLLGISGFEPQGRLLSGLLLVREQRPAEALPELQSAARDESTAVEALTAAAGCYYVLGQYVDAVNVARAALDRDESALDARRWLAAALYDLGITPDAAAELETISAKAPDDSRPERLLGLIDKDNERFAEAVTHYRESLRREPRQSHRETVLAELAESLVKLSRFDEALETLRECNRTAPVLTLEGECLQNQGRIDDAQQRFREALEVDADFFSARVKLGMLLLLQSRAEDAIGVLEEAARRAPHSSQVHFHLSQAYARRGARDKADEQLRLMRETQAAEREFTDLHEGAAKNPNDAEIRYRIGILAGRFGQLELSRLWFRAALAIQPSHARARAALAETDAR